MQVPRTNTELGALTGARWLQLGKQTRASESVNALAAGEREAMTERLRSFCAHSGIAFTDWDVAHPWQHALLRHLVQARSVC